MSQPGTLSWFAAHEFRLAWRDWRSMLTAGRQRRTRTIAIALIAVAAFMHFVAYKMVGGFAAQDGDPDKATLIAVTVAAMLAWSMMLSQALESVTRAFYARADLDLILSSPADARKVFIVRIAALGFSAVLTALAIAAPFINVLAYLGGPRWLGGYVAAVAMGRSRGSPGGRDDGSDVPPDRAEAHAARGTDHRRDHRRRLRHRAASGRDLVVRDDLAVHADAIGGIPAARARRRQFRVVAGARDPRRAGSARGSACGKSHAARHCDHGVLAALRRRCPLCGQRGTCRPAAGNVARTASARLRARARCA